MEDKKVKEERRKRGKTVENKSVERERYVGNVKGV